MTATCTMTTKQIFDKVWDRYTLANNSKGQPLCIAMAVLIHTYPEHDNPVINAKNLENFDRRVCDKRFKKTVWIEFENRFNNKDPELMEWLYTIDINAEII